MIEKAFSTTETAHRRLEAPLLRGLLRPPDTVLRVLSGGRTVSQGQTLHPEMAMLLRAQRLARETPVDAIEDCVSAYSRLRRHAPELGADPDRIAVGGPSAGGNLSTVLCLNTLRSGETAARPAGAPLSGHRPQSGVAVAS